MASGVIYLFAFLQFFSVGQHFIGDSPFSRLKRKNGEDAAALSPREITVALPQGCPAGIAYAPTVRDIPTQTLRLVHSALSPPNDDPPPRSKTHLFLVRD